MINYNLLMTIHVFKKYEYLQDKESVNFRIQKSEFQKTECFICLSINQKHLIELFKYLIDNV